MKKQCTFTESPYLRGRVLHILAQHAELGKCNKAKGKLRNIFKNNLYFWFVVQHTLLSEKELYSIAFTVIQ